MKEYFVLGLLVVYRIYKKKYVLLTDLNDVDDMMTIKLLSFFAFIDLFFYFFENTKYQKNDYSKFQRRFYAPTKEIGSSVKYKWTWFHPRIRFHQMSMLIKC